MFTPVHTRRTFEEAAEQIAGHVRAGRIAIGERLPGERALAAQMQISRPTLREAIRVLVDAGLVEVRSGPGGGMYVASDIAPLELVRQHSEMRIDEVSELLEARRLLEPRVAQLAAARATDEDLAPLERTIDGMRRLVAAGQGLEAEPFLAFDVQFHLALARATHNRTVERLVATLFRQLEAARGVAMDAPYVPEWTIAIHERTVAAVRSGDQQAVTAVMDEHLGQLERTWERESERALVRPLPEFLRRGGEQPRT